MIYAERFNYRTSRKNLEGTADLEEEKTVEKALIGFIHMEPADEEKAAAVETKLVKNLKWAARKNETETIVLHSFAHLAPAKADPELTKKLLDNAEQRLGNAGYTTMQTPFGYFLDLDIQAPGHSFSRLYKEF
jgi:hypothetical protein